MSNINIWWSIFKIILALFLVLLNAFFVAAEFSLVKVRKTKLAELADDGVRPAKVALEVTSKLDAYLSACQLGITLASLGLGWLGEPAIATLLAPLLSRLAGWGNVLTHTVASVIAFSFITFFHITLGEQVPKSWAIQKAEPVALGTAGLLRFFYRTFYPLIWALNYVSNGFLRLAGVHYATEADLAHSEEELRMIVEASQKHGHLDKMEGTLLDNVFEFSDRVVAEVMVPRQDMACLYAQDSFDTVMARVKRYGHTRYPLCDGDKDNVTGLIHLRDLLAFSDREEKPDISEIKRNILVAPENMPISHLVQKMRVNKTHMAVVVDEFGGTAGLVTIEDLIEELVGEIYDEFDKAEPHIVALEGGGFEVHGGLLLDDIEELIEVDFNDPDVMTVGGYILNRLGRSPRVGDKVNVGNYIFEVAQAKGARILLVRIKETEQY